VAESGYNRLVYRVATHGGISSTLLTCCPVDLAGPTNPADPLRPNNHRTKTIRCNAVWMFGQPRTVFRPQTIS